MLSRLACCNYSRWYGFGVWFRWRRLRPARSIFSSRSTRRSTGLSFNLSHTRGLIVLAVAAHRALGVDVEDVRAREVPLDLASERQAGFTRETSRVP